MTQLASCPFCGNTNVTAREAADDDRSWLVACDAKSRDCPMEVRVIECFSEEQAVAAWNRRSSTPTRAATDAGIQRFKMVYGDLEPRSDGPWVKWDDVALAVADYHAPKDDVPPHFGDVEGALDDIAKYLCTDLSHCATHEAEIRALQDIFADLRHLRRERQHVGPRTCASPSSTTATPNTLHPAQFDSIRAGDWFCEKCPKLDPPKRYRYFWNRDIAARSPDREAGSGTDDASTCIVDGRSETLHCLTHGVSFERGGGERIPETCRETTWRYPRASSHPVPSEGGGE
jgi:hypothetical protein